MKIKMTILIALCFASSYSSVIDELDATLKQKKVCINKPQGREKEKSSVSYGCLQRSFYAIKKFTCSLCTVHLVTEYFTKYAINNVLGQLFSYSHLLSSANKNRFGFVEKPYSLDLQKDRKPIQVHNMLVKFNPENPHLLGNNESDFMSCITPKQQAETYGGELIFLDTSLIPNSTIYNPSIISYGCKLYMTLRSVSNTRHPKTSATGTLFSEVTEDFKIISHYFLTADRSKTHEDARLVVFSNRLYASYVTDITPKFGPYSTCMEISEFAPGTSIDNPIVPNIDENRDPHALQKNWLFFEKGERFLVISTIDPMVVHDATDDLNNPVEIVRKERIIKEWPFGQIRCSTTPIWIEEENKYLSFFHSHILTTDGIREYFLGALLFDNDFNITNYTKKPLFVSTPHVKRYLYANTILPYGCIRQGDQLILSVGINDKAAAIMKLPVKRIISELTAKEG